MSSTITYNGSTITTVNNQTKILKTAGKYMEDDVTVVDVTGGSSSDIFVVTLSYNSSTEMWEPDCTYAEVFQAYSDNKTITVQTDVDSYIASSDGEWWIDEEDESYQGLYYTVYEYDDDHVEVNEICFMFDEDGLSVDYGQTFGVLSLQQKTFTPTRMGAIIEPDIGFNGLSEVIVNGIPNTYVEPTSTVGATTYRASTSSQTIASGTYHSAAATIAPVSQTNLEASKIKSGTTISVSNGQSNIWSVTGTYSGEEPNLQAKTNISPSTSSQTITPDSGYDGLSSVQINAMPSGTEGTPTATKGSVSNHSVNVTPSVTNVAGYISGGTHSGTAVSVSASELVNGSQTITENGTVDVTNLAEVVVDVQGGSSTVQIGTSISVAATNSVLSFVNLLGNPTSFAVCSQHDISTSGNVTACGIVYDGTSIHTTVAGSGGTSYDSMDISSSYSDGALTLTTEDLMFSSSGYYKLVYTYNGTSSDIHTANVQVGSGATSITFPSLSGNPIYWSCIFKNDFSTSSGYQRVMEVVNDGSSIYGLAMDSSANAQTSWTASYSGGSLTITSQSTNNGGYFHQPGYYQLTYAVDSSAPQYESVSKTYRASTSAQSETITPSSGYDAIEEVSISIPAVSQTNLAAANIKSGTTISISNGQSNLWSVTGTYTGGGGGSASIDTKTVTASNRPSSLSFTSMKGEPIAWFLRATFTMTSSSSTYYYVDSMRYNGTNTQGRLFRMGSTRETQAVTTGYSYTYSGTTLTVSSTGNRTTSPGCFYNGTYELVYVY